jgi:peptide/nickel transport system substrate-binding protein
VTFHDGSPFNAQTAKRSLDRTMSKTLTCGNRTKFFSDLTFEATAVDPYTLDIKTSRPDRVLPIRLAGTTIVGPNTPLDKVVLDPVGTGPYAFDSWQNGQQILLKRYDKYWGDKPQADGARFIWRDVSSVRAAMVAVNEADIALTIAEQDATNPKTDISYLNSETSFLRFDTSRPPLNDPRVRAAMNYAVDRASMIGSIMPKTVLQATQMVVPEIPGHNHELDKHIIPYDPAKAKQLLAEAKAAGVPVDTEITLLAYPARYPNAAEVMDAVFSFYKAVGLNVKVVTLEPGTYRKWSSQPLPADRGPNVLQTSHDNNSGDPVFSVFDRYSCNGNSSTYCDPVLDKELLRVSDLGGKERIAGWEAVFKDLYENVHPELFLFHMVGFTRVNPRIDFKPDITTNAEVRIQEIHFK